MKLLLGPPGSGKSTLLRTLAGRAERELRVQGEVTYNGRPGSHFVLPRSVAFVPQTDSHIGEMNVRETLEFSARLQGPGYMADLCRQLEEKEREMGIKPDHVMRTVVKAMGDEGRWADVVVPYVLKMLGLDVCADTMVGDSMRRGISGGEKKRLTIAEALLGAKQLLLLDEIPNGLDSATAHRIIRSLRSLTHVTNTTTLISLLQPAPETFELFDDVMLMSEGRIVYHGPREEVLGFFQEMGFVPPARKGVADFLQEVTSLKDQDQYWHPSQPHPYRYVSVQAFQEAFRASWFGKQMKAELSIPFKKDRITVKGEDEAKELKDMEEGQGKDVDNGGEEGNRGKEEEGASRALAQRRFVLPPLAALTVLAGREWLLMRQNLLLYIVQTVQILPLAIVTMTVFWRSQFTITPLDGNYYLGAMFFGIITMLFGGFIEITLLTARLPIFFLQWDNLLFPAWAWAVPMALLSQPVSLWSAGVWTPITSPTMASASLPNSPSEFHPGSFITQLMLYFLTHAATSALYRAMGVIFRSTVLVNTLNNFILTLLFLLSGFIITQRTCSACERSWGRVADIHGVWVWVYWLSPLTYMLNAFSTNEFLAPRWDVVCAAVPWHSSGPTATGWAAAAIGVFFTLFCNAVTILALKYLNRKCRTYISQCVLTASLHIASPTFFLPFLPSPSLLASPLFLLPPLFSLLPPLPSICLPSLQYASPPFLLPPLPSSCLPSLPLASPPFLLPPLPSSCHPSIPHGLSSSLALILRIRSPALPTSLPAALPKEQPQISPTHPTPFLCLRLAISNPTASSLLPSSSTLDQGAASDLLVSIRCHNALLSCSLPSPSDSLLSCSLPSPSDSLLSCSPPSLPNLHPFSPPCSSPRTPNPPQLGPRRSQ
ncbi:unnamed protein product [Closterium sp. NIES-64]|nr:unnamed protein product [Closterium sp. NIES-64]